MLKLPRALSGLLFAAVLAHVSALSGCFCGGADFEAGETEALIYLTDALTDATIADPTFDVDGEATEASCMEYDQHEPPRCISQAVVMSKGVHTINVRAPGYEPQSVGVDTLRIAAVHVAVQLEPVQE